MPKYDPCETSGGRNNSLISCSNGDNIILPELEVIEGKARAADDSMSLSILDVEMYKKPNMVNHHTDKYDSKNLVLRRGQEFIMGIVFSRQYDQTNDMVSIEFLIGNNPIRTQGTLITLTLGKGSTSNKWSCNVKETNGTVTKVSITPAADSIVGLYSTYVTVITTMGKQRTKRNQNTDFYVLFNAWSPLDQVFIDDEDERQEYVLNNVGIIYNGVYSNIGSRPWNYGQVVPGDMVTYAEFQRGILDACIFILDSGKMPVHYRGDATKVVRNGSSMINSQDDNGVLVGKWDENYTFGTAPTAWTGSTEILLTYASTGGVPVKFAQCWVYAGVFNSFLRCLGFPARVISNYCSAHDNMGNLKTDIVIDEDGRLDSSVSDSIWNFHCWNEVCYKRSDIPSVYSGWQVVDATPQETSDGYYRCGPSSVIAIKEGQLSYPFDVPFVFAEVNSDVVYHKRDKYGNSKVIFVDRTYVGKLIVTKRIGFNDPTDITETYKKPEDDYRSLLNFRTSGMDRHHSLESVADVQLQIETNPTQSGSDINLTMSLKNLSNEQRSLTVSLTVKAEHYTGATRNQFKFITREVKIQPLKTIVEVITLTASEYKDFTRGQPFLAFIVYAFIKETSLSLTAMTVTRLNNPPILIEVKGDSQVGKEMFVTIGFTNTTGYDLNNVTLRIEGTDLIRVKTKKYRTIQSGSKIKWIESVTPKVAGSKMLVACLDCAAIRDVHGHISIDIQPES